MNNLYKSPVVFDSESHSYTLNGNSLSGITSRLGQSIFFINKYKGVPQSVLNSKAEYGSFIHELFETVNNGEMCIETDEVISYKKMLEKHKIKPYASEYLVSDEEKYATMIDMLDVDFNFYDHKTTYKLDKEYLSWQLSINKYLFFKQNNIIGGKLYVNWVKDKKCSLIEIKEKTFEEVEDMLYTDKYMYKDGSQLPQIDSKPVLSESDVLVLYDIEKSIFELENSVKELSKKRERFIELAKENMDKNDIDKWETDSFVITRVKPYTSSKFNSKLFKEDMPDLYEKYTQDCNVSGSIKIKLKKI